MNRIALTTFAILLTSNASAFFNIYTPKNWVEYRASRYLNGSYVYDEECNTRTYYYNDASKQYLSDSDNFSTTLKEDVLENGMHIISQETQNTFSTSDENNYTIDLHTIHTVTRARIEGNKSYTTMNDTITQYVEEEDKYISRNRRTEIIEEMNNGEINRISTKIDGAKYESDIQVERETLPKDPFFSNYITITKFTYGSHNNTQTAVCEVKMRGINSYLDLIPRVLIGSWNIDNSNQYRRIEFLTNKTFRIEQIHSENTLKGSYQLEGDRIVMNLENGDSYYLKMKFDSMINFSFDKNTDESFFRGALLNKVLE